MPIEIRELNIRVSVNQSPAEQDSKPSGGGGGSGGGDKDEIIAECVEQILEILKNKNER
ncbi:MULTISPECIES: DUF5908 family protein [Mucilaginibacter]|uniref:Uncharacterized protein n=1 Tax=Mucilaginibacter rubeus TaxID=2027860 RepID=A0ABX7UMT1_9SPHI|nr:MULTISPECIES: DUF5908 family protein [Mucilaginibacter]QTE46205.1 hypothetical protein J3L19_12890 [Mucilaginibacter rubeus]QTE52802.1 hypothetical protein J3L21_12865 [Mucilaginibacter rubeus]QTE57889.1 hypothetical protein J3L23_04540 [Mucilaginibacter rubeus]QTE62650.1 hypothetical protein J3L22_29325 [Mucilaginibacter rubeus]QTF61407.1 hypothetical protein J3L20_28945 [Mucilaginibacter rubeus]